VPAIMRDFILVRMESALQCAYSRDATAPPAECPVKRTYLICFPVRDFSFAARNGRRAFAVLKNPACASALLSRAFSAPIRESIAYKLVSYKVLFLVMKFFYTMKSSTLLVSPFRLTMWSMMHADPRMEKINREPGQVS
jgi:hypothetical protein